MRARASRIIATVILVTCLVCPLVEMFDNWDHAVQTGNDSEYALVVLALCVGVAYSFARFLVKSSLTRCTAKSKPAFSVQISLLSALFSLNSLFNATSTPPLDARLCEFSLALPQK